MAVLSVGAGAPTYAGPFRANLDACLAAFATPRQDIHALQVRVLGASPAEVAVLVVRQRASARSPLVSDESRVMGASPASLRSAKPIHCVIIGRLTLLAWLPGPGVAAETPRHCLGPLAAPTAGLALLTAALAPYTGKVLSLIHI